jgi:hypothetical protein
MHDERAGLCADQQLFRSTLDPAHELAADALLDFRIDRPT